jgi:hypothetical protein
MMFVTLNGFNQPYPSRPSFVLRKGIDNKGFSFYLECFESIPGPGAEEVKLR